MRAITQERPLKRHRAKGLMMDKIVGSVQIFLDTDERAHQLQQKQHALELAQEKSIKEKEQT